MAGEGGACMGEGIVSPAILEEDGKGSITVGLGVVVGVAALCMRRDCSCCKHRPVVGPTMLLMPLSVKGNVRSHPVHSLFSSVTAVA